MDAAPNVREEFWRLLNRFILMIEEEQHLMEEIINDDGEEIFHDDIIIRDGFADLDEVLEAVVGGVLQLEMLEMAAGEEDQVMLELVYGRNQRIVDWRRNLPRMEYMRRMEDPTFQQHFRMDRHTFEALIVVVGNHLLRQGRLTRLRTEIDKCLLMALWILFNLDTFRATGVVFGVSRGVVHFHYLVVIEALRELASNYIKWPSPHEREVIKHHFAERNGYPGAVGALDGILIRCYAPKIQRERYFDRHQAYSINVQAICDHNLVFRHIYVGEPGSVHDNRCLQRSPIYNLLLDGEDLVRDNEHIIADGGYECFKKVLTPYRDLGNLTPRQRRFNFTLSSNRMCIERSFGVLRSRMRRLLKLYIKRFEYTVDHIVSSFVLHNFMRLGGRELDGICIIPLQQPHHGRNNADLEDEEEDEDAIRDGGLDNTRHDINNAEEIPNIPQRGRRINFDHPLLAQSKLAGIEKRNAIALQLFPNQ